MNEFDQHELDLHFENKREDDYDWEEVEADDDLDVSINIEEVDLLGEEGFIGRDLHGTLVMVVMLMIGFLLLQFIGA